MFCIKCGAQIRDDAQFCPRCGAKVAEQTESEAIETENAATYEQKEVISGFGNNISYGSNTQKKKSSAPLIAIVFIAIAVFVIVTLTIYSTYMKPNLTGTWYAEGYFFFDRITFNKDGTCEMEMDGRILDGKYSRRGENYKIKIVGDTVSTIDMSRKIEFEAEKEDEASMIILAVPDPYGYVAWLGVRQRFWLAGGYDYGEEYDNGYEIYEEPEIADEVYAADDYAQYADDSVFDGDISGAGAVFTITQEEDVPDTEFNPTGQEIEDAIEVSRQVYYEPGDNDYKAIVPLGHEGWDLYREYYYKDGKLRFAFLYDEERELRLYFLDEHLIRYIDADHNTHEFGSLGEFNDLAQEVLEEARRYAN